MATDLSVMEWGIALWLGLGLLTFSAWAIRIWASAERPRHFWAAPTSWLVWHCGAGLVWLASLLLAGGVFGLAARSVWRLLSS